MDRVDSTTEAVAEMKPFVPLELPSNATSIRAEISDSFSCENRGYGYYADVENECQIFHVCLPVVYSSETERKERTFRWSFICPEETVFSQVLFTCVRMEDMQEECKDSADYYDLNMNLGMIPAEETAEQGSNSVEEDSKTTTDLMHAVEMTTDSKVIMENQKMNVVDMSGMKVVINRPVPTTTVEGLLPPLSSEVYRAGLDGESQIHDNDNEVAEDNNDSTTEIAYAKADAKQMRRIADPRNRRFLFKADVAPKF